MAAKALDLVTRLTVAVQEFGLSNTDSGPSIEGQLMVSDILQLTRNTKEVREKFLITISIITALKKATGKDLPISADQALKLAGLYKQAIYGDAIEGNKPQTSWMQPFDALAKNQTWEQWTLLSGMTREQARIKYTAAVDKILSDGQELVPYKKLVKGVTLEAFETAYQEVYEVKLDLLQTEDEKYDAQQKAEHDEKSDRKSAADSTSDEMLEPPVTASRASSDYSTTSSAESSPRAMKLSKTR